MLKMKHLSLALVLAIISIGLIGCGGATTTDNKPATNKPATNTPATNTPATNTPATNTPATNTPAANKETASGGDKVGVPECDEYIEKYEACITEKVPEAQRAMFKTSFETLRKGWKDAAATPQGKAGLATGCKAALDSAKTSMGSFGCKF
jgi:hypothetical protein